MGERTVNYKSTDTAYKIVMPYERDISNDIEEIPLSEYALFDMNGDDRPELHTFSWRGYDIFTCQDGELTHWYSSNMYTQPLNNKAVLRVDDDVVCFDE